MQANPGVFIALEGSDGSGKGTQFRLLAERLKAVGHEVAVFDFPRYEEPSSHFVRQYLKGEYGPASEVGPYTASIFYALDRYEAAPKIKEALDSGCVVLANRYAGSNMAHQGAKFTNEHEQRGFFMWADNLEYQVLAIPRPNINLFLRVPPEMSQQLIAKRAKSTGVSLDEHEKNQDHLTKAVAAYDLLCKLFPRDFKEIECVQNGQLLGIVEINDMIWEGLKPLLPEPRRKGMGAVLRLDHPVEAIDRSNNSPKKNGSDLDVSHILLLQKKLSAKAASTKGVNQQQLKSAINLLTPLLYRKSKLRSLLDKPSDVVPSISDEPVAVNQIIKRLADSIPSPTDDEPIKLLAANPRNEFLLLSEAKSANLNYRQKEQALAAILGKEGSITTYRFEATTSYNTMLIFASEVDAKPIKIYSSKLVGGPEVPEVIETAGLEDLFSNAVGLSNELYDQLVAKGHKDARYALLLCHRVHWKFEISATVLANVLKKSTDHELLSFLSQLIAMIDEQHPHVGKMLRETKKHQD